MRIQDSGVYLASDESKNVNGKRFRAQGDNPYDSDNNVKQQTLVSELKKAKEESEGRGEEDDDGAFDPLIEQQHSYQQQLQPQHRLIVP